MTVIRMRKPGLFGAIPGRRRADDMLRLFENEMGRLADHFSDFNHKAMTMDQFPRINIWQDMENLYLTAELPGIEKGDVDIQAADDSVILKGMRKVSAEESTGAYHRRERPRGSFERQIMLPTRIATDRVSATLKKGILRLTLPKSRNIGPRHIDIQAD